MGSQDIGHGLWGARIQDTVYGESGYRTRSMGSQDSQYTMYREDTVYSQQDRTVQGEDQGNMTVKFVKVQFN